MCSEREIVKSLRQHPFVKAVQGYQCIISDTKVCVINGIDNVSYFLLKNGIRLETNCIDIIPYFETIKITHKLLSLEGYELCWTFGCTCKFASRWKAIYTPPPLLTIFQHLPKEVSKIIYSMSLEVNLCHLRRFIQKNVAGRVEVAKTNKYYTQPNAIVSKLLDDINTSKNPERRRILVIQMFRYINERGVRASKNTFRSYYLTILCKLSGLSSDLEELSEYFMCRFPRRPN